MMDVQRWDWAEKSWEMEHQPEGDWVLFTDHEAALAAARDWSFRQGQEAEREWFRGVVPEEKRQEWNAALDAVRSALEGAIGPGADSFSIYVHGNALNAIAALRKPTPQPEPLIWVPCEYCGGGGMADDGACLNCHGRGDVQIERVAAAQPEGGE